MPDTPIATKIREVDAAIDAMIKASHGANVIAHVHGYRYDGPDMIEPIRRLVRKLAKVAQERMRERAGAVVCMEDRKCDLNVAALPLEEVEDE